MITNGQIKNLDRKYFIVHEANRGYVILQSKSTNHFWYLKSPGDKPNIIIYHSHTGPYDYHEHGKAKDLSSAISQVVKHDTYQLKHRSPEYHLGYSKEQLLYMTENIVFYY